MNEQEIKQLLKQAREILQSSECLFKTEAAYLKIMDLLARE